MVFEGDKTGDAVTPFSGGRTTWLILVVFGVLVRQASSGAFLPWTVQVMVDIDLPPKKTSTANVLSVV
jgi:hypothetical protein